MSDELQEIKEEIAGLATRMGNVEGHFDNFNTTLENHMTDYKEKLAAVINQLASLKSQLGWGFWVLFGLMTVALAGLVGTSAVLVQYIINRGGLP